MTPELQFVDYTSVINSLFFVAEALAHHLRDTAFKGFENSDEPSDLKIVNDRF